MQSLRLLADDLTGALDTAAEFVRLCGTFDVTWTDAPRSDHSSSVAIDSGTRECDRMQSVAIVKRLVPMLRDGSIAFKKVDSLLRGPWAAELAACLESGFWRSCIVAPAFPYQGRFTRNGRQYVRKENGSWLPVGDSLLKQLAAENIQAHTRSIDVQLNDGVHVLDAQSDGDLDRVVALGRRASHPVLWCGSSGLAAALARSNAPTLPRTLRKPVLGFFGSDQPATAMQLAACGAAAIGFPEVGDDHAGMVRRKLNADGIAFVKFDLAPGVSRGDAALRIARALASVTAALEPPGTLIVAGGETLRALCAALGAHALKVTGRIVPGLPCSTIQGGRWDGVEVISKSGAFGAPDLWRKLLEENQLISERHDT
ncbi:four-carbon acid sugar kinase family protein [Bradyrhizobium sp. ORS 86]|uniref:four-carbon acid sugar kinase family protein n=1 Tax=Bradyrhizobium sp. ORS 86 TaxID=1685970 RepID=UPI00388E02BE